MKDNPSPLVIPIQCQGERPTVEVDADVIEFERQLLNTETVKRMTIRNSCNLPILWKLLGGESLSEEIKVNSFEGKLRPKAEAVVEV